MKKLLLFCFLLAGLQSAFAQTIDVQYINPLLGDYSRYKFVRLGTSLEHYSGWMWNNTDPTFGNGNDVSLFTYGDRDLTFSSGYGNIVFFPSKGGKIGVGTTSPESKLEVVQSGTIGRKFNPAGAHLRLNDGSNSLLMDANEIYGGKELILGFNPNSYFELTTVSGTGYTSLMKVDGTGKVGIGTTAPQEKLHVGGAGESVLIGNQASTTHPALRLLGGYTNGYTYIQAGGAASPKLRFTNYSTIDQNLEEFQVFATESFFSGKLGIGTTAPGSSLDIKAQESNQDLLRLSHPTAPDRASFSLGFGQDSGLADNAAIDFKVEYSDVEYKVLGINRQYRDMYYIGDGNFGIGTIAPKSKLHIEEGTGTLRTMDNGDGMVLSSFSNTKSIGLSASDNGNYGGAGSVGLKLNGGDILFISNGTLKTVFKNNGQVGIGTTDPGTYHLAVNGDVKAKKVNVTLEGWSDFVFEEDYVLRPLAEVEQFIKAHKHLPDVPSEAEVLEKGVELGEMNSLLLQKIEELTLYQIELLKIVEKLEQKVAALEEEKK